MNLSITYKLFIVILVVAVATGCLTFALTEGSVESGIANYMNRIELSQLAPVCEWLESEYSKNNSWLFLRRRPFDLRYQMAESMAMRPSSPAIEPDGLPGIAHRRPPVLTRSKAALLDRLLVFDAGSKQVFGSSRLQSSEERRGLYCDGKEVGYIKLLEDTADIANVNKRYSEEKKKNIGIIAGIVILLSVLATMFLSSNILKPIKLIIEGSKRLSEGDFSQRIELRRSDELQELASDFNRLAIALNKHEQSRMQWMVDTSHELRTPIAILRAQIEAFQDGVQEVSPKKLAVLHGEIMSLNRLVDQLYDLCRADLGRFSCRLSVYNPTFLVEECVDSFSNRFDEKGISIETELLRSEDIRVQCDPDLLKQLFSNLLENSLRYTNSSGCLKVSSELAKDRFYLRFDDTEPAVPDEHYDRLFERFYRVDSSRSRLLGGTGLGLAICKNIVESHSGEISASRSPVGGLRIEIWLPLERKAVDG